MDTVARGLGARALSTSSQVLANSARLFAPTMAQRVAATGIAPTYTAGVVNFTPAATPTDVFALTTQNYSRKVALRRISISGVATTAATIDVLLQKSANGGGGTQNSLSSAVAKLDSRDSTTLQSGIPYYYTVNRTSGGNGVSSSRPVLAVGRMTFATSTTAGTPCVWEFGTRGDKCPTINELVEWIVLNLNGQAMPSGATLSIDCEWVEEAAQRVTFAGDSTTSNASTLFSSFGNSGLLNSYAIVDNMGSNGFRLTDFINNTNAVTYPMSAVATRAPPVLVLCYGINDVRTGATSQAQLISMIDAVIYATLNGVTSGATYTSPLGAGTTFTWPSTMAANPDCKIILWGPNSLLADDPTSSGYVTTTGLFAGMTLAQAAQTATDILYGAYAAFLGDSRIYALLQKQDYAVGGVSVFGRTVRTGANNPNMTDILHPNARGQTLEGRQLMPTLVGAIQAAFEYAF